MKIVQGVPPNYPAIVAVFPHARRKGTIFTWGDTVYVNGVPELSPQLKAHEAVHSHQQRQCGGAAAWWARYLVDDQFRLKQEIIAHRAEYRTAKHWVGRKVAPQALELIAARLASPLYGSLISLREAKRALLA